MMARTECPHVAGLSKAELVEALDPHPLDGQLEGEVGWHREVGLSFIVLTGLCACMRRGG